MRYFRAEMKISNKKKKKLPDWKIDWKDVNSEIEGQNWENMPKNMKKKKNVNFTYLKSKKTGTELQSSKLPRNE